MLRVTRSVAKFRRTNVNLSHCTCCGTQHTGIGWPKTCGSCNSTEYKNPLPVAVGLLPFRTKGGKVGILLARRSIKPSIGELCLPGGFINYEESWQEAISREVQEETMIKAHPSEFFSVGIHSTPDKTRILIFGATKTIRDADELRNFTETNETSEILIGDINTKLCFSLHQLVYDNLFTSSKE